jgi:hypothetical protein
LHAPHYRRRYDPSGRPDHWAKAGDFRPGIVKSLKRALPRRVGRTQQASPRPCSDKTSGSCVNLQPKRVRLALLRGDPLSPADAAGEQREMRGSVLDMMPPQAAGLPWTAPECGWMLGKGFEGLGQRYSDGRLRDLLHRVQTGSFRGLEDLVKLQSSVLNRRSRWRPIRGRVFANAAGSRHYKLYIPACSHQTISRRTRG